MKIRSILLLLLLLVQVAWSNAAEVQNWPSRPIRLVIPAPAGSPIDVVSRLVGAQMQASLGQPVVIDNRPGADLLKLGVVRPMWLEHGEVGR